MPATKISVEVFHCIIRLHSVELFEKRKVLAPLTNLPRNPKPLDLAQQTLFSEQDGVVPSRYLNTLVHLENTAQRQKLSAKSA